MAIPKDPDTLQHMKEVELKILIAVDEVCKKLNIDYALDGGTLLGAARHSGFIPWDDDIDLLMPREDYERFIATAQEYLPKEYKIRTFLNTPEYPYLFIKVDDTRTLLVEENLRHLNSGVGIFIDIFPIDGFPETKFKQKLYYLKCRFYLNILSTLFYDKTDNLWPKPYRMYIALMQALPLNRFKIQKKFDAYMKKQKLNSSTLGFSPTAGTGKKIGVNKNILFPTRRGKYLFEKNDFKVPNQSEEYLIWSYENYTELPKEEERYPHHDAFVSFQKE